MPETSMDPYSAYRHALETLNGPFPEGEAIIASNAFWSYKYAENVLKGRFLLGEPAIFADDSTLAGYMAFALTDPISELEGRISKSAKLSYAYSRYIIKGKWEPGEKTICKSIPISLMYAADVLSGPFKLAEQTHIFDPDFAYHYALKVIKGRWLDGEPTIIRSPLYSFLYARDVIKGRWEPGEVAISLNVASAIEYVKFIKSEFHSTIGADVHQILLSDQKLGFRYKILLGIMVPLSNLGIEPQSYEIVSRTKIVFNERKIDKAMLPKIPPIIQKALGLKKCSYEPGEEHEPDFVKLKW